MTTDVAETEVLQQGDAANQATDAAENGNQIDAAEADVSAFLESSKEGTSKGGTEADAEDTLLAEAREAAAKAATEKAERETRDRIAREEAQRKADTDAREAQAQFRKSYDERMARQLGLEQELTDQGIDLATARAIARRVADDFNAHHADGLKLHEPMANSRAWQGFGSMFNQGISEALGDSAEKYFGPESEPKRYANIADALKAFREIVTDGLLSKSEAEADTKVALLKYRKSLEDKGLIAGAKSGQQVNSNGGGSLSHADEDAVLLDMNVPQSQKDAILRKRGML